MERYGLVCCQHGRWKDRVIIPLYVRQELIGWTACAIQATINAPRYLVVPPEIKQTIFNEDGVRNGGRTLFITEGPFDAMKVDFTDAKLMIAVTRLFGVNATAGQMGVLRPLLRKFERVKILFDHSAFDNALHASDWLSWPNVCNCNPT